MPPSTDIGPFAPHLEPGEQVLWQAQPGPAHLAPEEQSSSFRHALFGAAVGSVLASLAEVPTTYLPAVFVTLAIISMRWMRRTMQLSPTRAYAVTSTRLLILEEGRLRAFSPDDVPYVKVVTMRDGTVDVFWGEDKRAASSTSASDSNRARASMRFFPLTRATRRGFLALPAAEPVVSFLTTWRQAPVSAAARAVPALAVPPSSHESAGAAPSATGAWRTVREPSSGFAVDVPASWTAQAATVRKIWIFEPEPVWGTADRAGWNRLEVHPAVSHVGIRININPPTMPASLAEVLSSKWARVLQLRTVEQFSDVRIGSLVGFSVVQDLQGVGGQVSFGPVRVGTERNAVAALSRQWWLTGNGQSVHVMTTWPTDAHDMRAVLEQAITSIRCDGRR